MGDKAKKLVTEVEKRMKELAAETDEVKKSEAFTTFMGVMSKFHNYSFYNQMLIAMQNPDATLVAGYKTWQGMSRQVQKGEKSIRILAPGQSKCKETDEVTGEETEKVVSYFFSVSVFDISQTEGDPLPIPDHRVKGDNWRPFLDSLIELCDSKDITLEFTDLGLLTGGISYGGKIEINNERSINEQVATSIHEIAHEILHKDNRRSAKGQKEIEAESVTHIVLTHFGLESKSSTYLAAWNADHEKMMASLHAISRAAAEIIGWLAPSLEQKKAAA